MPQLPFESITIGSFRRLRNVTLSELRPVNVLVGENNAGKTSVLEAIALLCRPTDTDAWVQVATKREALVSGEAPLDSMKWIFPISWKGDRAIAGEIGIEVVGGVPIRSFRARYKEQRILRSSEKGPRDEALGGSAYGPANVPPGGRLVGTISVQAQFKDGKTADAERSFVEDQPLSTLDDFPQPQTPAAFFGGHDHRLAPVQAVALRGARRKGTLDEALRIVRHVDPEVEDIALEGSTLRPGIYLHTSRTGPAPLSSFGDATRRAVMIAMVTPNTANGVLLLDEVETSVYKGVIGTLLGTFVQAARKQNAQLFLTTHMLEAVDAVERATDAKDLAVYRLEGTDGNTKVTRIAGEVVKRGREELGLDLR